MLKPFLCRPEQLPQESLPSLLHRTMRANLYSPAQFWLACRGEYKWRIPKDPIQFEEAIEQLGDLMKLDGQTVYWASIHGYQRMVVPSDKESGEVELASGQRLPLIPSLLIRRHFYSDKKAQYCPHCLAELAFQRRIWRLRLAAACPKHQCLLLNKCPQCEAATSTADVALGTCGHCQFELKQAEAPDLSFDEDGLATQSLLYWWFSAGHYQWSDMPRQPTHVLYQLLYLLVHMIFRVRQSMSGLHPHPPQEGKKRWRLVYKRAQSDYYVAVATAMKALARWPDGFFELLHAYGERDDKQLTARVSTKFSSLLEEESLELLQTTEFEFAYKAFREYLAQSATPTDVHTIAHFAQNPIPIGRFKWVTQADAAKKLQVCDATIFRLGEMGKIQRHPTLMTSKGNSLYWAKDVKALHHLWFNNSVPLADAAEIMGLSTATTLDLKDMSLIQANRGPNIDLCQNWWICSLSIMNLLDALEWAATSRESAILGKNETVSLIKSAQILAPQGATISVLIDWILRQRIKAIYWRKEGVGGIRFTKIEIKNFQYNMWKTRELIPITTAARQWRKRPSALKAWVKSGILKAHFLDCGTYIHVDEIKAFNQNYLLAKEAAEIIGVNLLVIQKWCRNGRLRPVSGSGVDSQAAYLFRRKDVERLRPENRLTAPDLAQYLGLGRSQLNAWIRSGKLQPVSGPGIDQSGHYLFLKDSLPLSSEGA